MLFDSRKWSGLRFFMMGDFSNKCGNYVGNISTLFNHDSIKPAGSVSAELLKLFESSLAGGLRGPAHIVRA